MSVTIWHNPRCVKSLAGPVLLREGRTHVVHQVTLFP